MTLQDIKESMAIGAQDSDGYFLPDHTLLKVDEYVTRVAEAWATLKVSERDESIKNLIRTNETINFELAKCQSLLEGTEVNYKYRLLDIQKLNGENQQLQEQISTLRGQIERLKSELHNAEWIKSSERMPEFNIGVLVFIPQEDNHITSGMWDVGREWVLLDEYRIPQSEVTYWMPIPREPLDKSYKPCTYIEKSPDDTLRDCQRQNFLLTKKCSNYANRVHELEDTLGLKNNG